MAAADGSIRIDTKIDASKANKGISSLGESVKKLGSLVAAAFAITKVISFAKASVSAYATQIEVEQQLTTVLRNRYNATQEQIDAVKELTAAQQALGVVGDETQMSGLKTLATYIGDMEELTSLTGAMNDLLAFQYGFNGTPEGAKAVAKAMGQAVSTGSLSLLKRMGVAVDEQTESEFALANESERVAMLQALIEEKVGGVNAALADTPYGRIVQLKNAWGDFQELIGEAASTLLASFVPALMKGLDILSGLARKLIEVSKAINIVFSGSSSAGNDQIEDAAKSAAKAEDGLAESIDGVGEAIAGNLAGFDELNVMSATGSEADDAAEAVGGFSAIGEDEEVSPQLIESVQTFKDILDSIGAVLRARLEQFKEFAGAVWGIVEAIRGGGDVGEAFSNVIDLITKNAMNFVGSIQSFIENHGKEIVEAAKNIIVSIVQGISENLPKIVSAAVEIVLMIVDTLTDESMLQTIIDAAVEIIVALVEGISDCLPSIIEAAINIVLALFNALTSPDTIKRLSDAAVRIVVALASGLSQAVPHLIEAVPKLISAIIETIFKTDWLKVGIDIIKGIGQGLIDGVKNIGSAIGNACKNIWSTIKGWFGIKSPSKLMHDTVGNYIAEGIGEGFEDEIGDVADDMKQALKENVDLEALADVGDIPAPTFNLDEAIPYKVACEICKEKGDTFERMADSIEEIAEDVKEIRQSGADKGGTYEPRGSSRTTTARETIDSATRENRKAGKTIIPVGT